MSAMLVNLNSPTSCAVWKLKNPGTNPFPSSKQQLGVRVRHRQRHRHSSFHLGENKCGVKAFFFNPTQDYEPILKEALKEPVAFAGGMFAGLLRLDLNEDPLKEWITRTVEASGITEEEVEAEGQKPEEVPQQIEIE